MDPAALPGAYDLPADFVPYDNGTINSTTENTPLLLPPADITLIGSVDNRTGTRPSCEDVALCGQPLSLVAVVIKLARSPRALVALIITFSYG